MLGEDEAVLTRTAPAPAWPLDVAHLRRFTMGDEALEREVLGLFTAETPRRIEALRKATSDRDWKMGTHTLKGSGRAVGAWRFAQSAQQAESLGGVADRKACSQAIDRLAREAEAVEAYICVIYPPLSE